VKQKVYSNIKHGLIEPFIGAIPPDLHSKLLAVIATFETSKRT
jgi:hypothetical protein